MSLNCDVNNLFLGIYDAVKTVTRCLKWEIRPITRKSRPVNLRRADGIGIRFHVTECKILLLKVERRDENFNVLTLLFGWRKANGMVIKKAVRMTVATHWTHLEPGTDFLGEKDFLTLPSAVTSSYKLSSVDVAITVTFSGLATSCKETPSAQTENYLQSDSRS